MLLVPIRMRIMRKFTLKRLGGLALLAVVAAVAIAPATALAQDALSNPSADQYQPQSQVQGTSTTGSNQAGCCPGCCQHLGFGPQWKRRLTALHGYGRDRPRGRGGCSDWYWRRTAQALRAQGPQGVSQGNKR